MPNLKKPNKLVLLAPDDFHVHFRDDDNTAEYLWAHAFQFRRALVMPNLRPKPVLTAVQALAYRERLLAKVPKGANFTPLMTIQLTDKTTVKMIRDAARVGVTAGKLYPEGVTTNSSNGVTDLSKLHRVFEAMSDHQMNLCIHAEAPGVYVMNRELFYLGGVSLLAETFPYLRITIEHASTSDAVRVVMAHKNVAASITAHHLELTLDDVIGDGIRPHNYCKPIAKTEQDRDDLRAAAFSGHPRFFLGSDSAPHPRAAKECACGAAGVYTGPILLPLLATRFEAHGHLDKLESFTSVFGALWYNLLRNEGSVTLLRVPRETANTTPLVETFMNGKMLAWTVGNIQF